MEQEKTFEFAKRFNKLRGSESQKDFAIRLGISRPTVGFYENGSRLPQADVLKQIAERCNVSTDWLLGLSDYIQDASKPITLYELGFSEASANQIASIAGAVTAASDMGEQASEKKSLVQNPDGYTCRDEARAFLALNALLQNPKIVQALSNAWAYMRFTGSIPQGKSVMIEGDGGIEPFSAPTKVLIDALWNRVEEPLRDILDTVAQEVQQGTRTIDIPKTK